MNNQKDNIIDDPLEAYKVARRDYIVFSRRKQEYEKILLRSLNWSFYYVMDVVKDRWEPIENILFFRTNKFFIKEYYYTISDKTPIHYKFI